MRRCILLCALVAVLTLNTSALAGKEGRTNHKKEGKEIAEELWEDVKQEKTWLERDQNATKDNATSGQSDEESGR